MKRKGPSSTNKKQLEREAQASYSKLVEKWETVPKFARTSNLTRPSSKLELNLGPPPGRATPKIESRSTQGASTAKREVIPYTGTKMIGIGQMHKSNSVPIFSQEEAEDVAKMRRN